MKIRCTQKYAKEIAQRLDALQGRSSVATMSVTDVFNMSNEMLALKRKFGKKACGSTREFCEGGARANAYKYARPATYIRIDLDDGCYVTDIGRRSYYPKSGRINRINLSPAVHVERGYRLGKKLAGKINALKNGKNKAVVECFSGENVFFAVGVVRALLDKKVITSEVAAETLKKRMKVLKSAKWTDESMKNELFDFAGSGVRFVVDLMSMPIDQSIDFSFSLYAKRNSTNEIPQVEIQTGVIEESLFDLDELMVA
jgi:hypothetical protein